MDILAAGERGCGVCGLEVGVVFCRGISYFIRTVFPTHILPTRSSRRKQFQQNHPKHFRAITFHRDAERGGLYRLGVPTIAKRTHWATVFASELVRASSVFFLLFLTDILRPWLIRAFVANRVLLPASSRSKRPRSLGSDELRELLQGTVAGGVLSRRGARVKSPPSLTIGRRKVPRSGILLVCHILTQDL